MSNIKMQGRRNRSWRLCKYLTIIILLIFLFNRYLNHETSNVVKNGVKTAYDYDDAGVVHTSLGGPVSQEREWDQDDKKFVKYVLNNGYIEPPSNLAYNLDSPDQDPSMGQSQFIRKLLKNMTGGFFVECGAFDGETLSNTLYLERHLGWRGLLIEGNPFNYDLLKKKHRKAWTSKACLAIKQYQHHARFVLKSHQSKIIDPANPWENKRKAVIIQCKPLFTLLSAINVTTVDYFSLDVVGRELQILRSIPFDKVLIKTLSVEVSHGPMWKEKLLNFMNDKGYIKVGKVIHPSGLANDIIFARKDLSFNGSSLLPEL